jgi:hypothetical protein
MNWFPRFEINSNSAMVLKPVHSQRCSDQTGIRADKEISIGLIRAFLKLKMFGSSRVHLYSGEALVESMMRLIPKTADTSQRESLRKDIDAMILRFERLRFNLGVVKDEADLQPICHEMRSACESPILRNMHEMALVHYIARIDSPFTNVMGDRYVN